MTRIAFCDDDAALLHQMQDFLEQYRTLRGVQLELFPYTKPMELLADIEAGVRFDVLFLDVLMPGINGINAAREIRRYDQSVRIIFLTSSAEFAVESYTVGAYFYQLKPIWQESFFRLLDSVIAECAKSGSMSRCRFRRVPQTHPAQPDPALQKRRDPHYAGQSGILRGAGAHVGVPPTGRHRHREQRQHGRVGAAAGRLPGLSAPAPLLSGQYGIHPEHHRQEHHHGKP